MELWCAWNRRTVPGPARKLPSLDGMFLPAFPPLSVRRPLPRRGRRAWRTEDVFPAARLFARGRFALFEGIRALARVRGVRRVWLPAYLCRPVVDVTRALGLATALYDVDDRLEPVWRTVAPVRGDALLVLHYFGLALPPTVVQQFCVAHGMPLIEDCAHTVPDPSAAAQVGSQGALSVFSLRKQMPVPGGGLLVLNDPELGAAVRAPARAGVGDHRTLIKLGIMLAERLAFALDCNVLTFKDRLPVLDAHPGDAPGRLVEAALADLAAYLRPPAPTFLLRPMLARLDWRARIRTRQFAYRRLAGRLADVSGVAVPVATPRPGAAPQALPVRVADPERVVRALRVRGVEAMRWPGREQVPFDPVACPNTVRWLQEGLILPLGCALTRSRLDAVVRTMREAVGSPALSSHRSAL